MILVNTNVLVAMAGERDSLHQAAMDLLTAMPAGQLVLPTVLAEACYLINAHDGVAAEVALLRSFAAGDFTLEPLVPADLERMAELVERYASVNPGAHLTPTPSRGPPGGPVRGSYRATTTTTPPAMVDARGPGLVHRRHRWSHRRPPHLER